MPEVTFTTRGALGKSALRQANERLVLNAVRQRQSISRADLVRATGLSPSSMTFIIGRLLRERLVEETRNGSGANQVGRQPTPLRLRPEARLLVAVEVRKSASRVVLGDWTGTTLKSRTVLGKPDQQIYLGGIQAAIAAMLEGAPQNRVLGIGVAVPGTVDRRTGRVAAENLGWFGLDLGQALRGKLTAPIYIENEAKLSAQAELWFRDPAQPLLRNFVFVAASEGIGAGVIANGVLIHGASGGAGEFGHVVLHPDGLPCPCGNRGCWEQYGSAAALVRYYGKAVSCEEVIRRAREGDRKARAAIQQTAAALAIGFGNLLFALNPEAIIVGDYIAQAWDLLEEPVWNVLRNRVPAYYLSGLRILPSTYGSDAALRGAEALVLSRYFTTFDEQDRTTPGVMIRTA